MPLAFPAVMRCPKVHFKTPLEAPKPSPKSAIKPTQPAVAPAPGPAPPATTPTPHPQPLAPAKPDYTRLTAPLQEAPRPYLKKYPEVTALGPKPPLDIPKLLSTPISVPLQTILGQLPPAWWHD